MKKLTDPSAGLHPVHTRIAMLHLAGMSDGAIALFLGTSNDTVCAVRRMPRVLQYITGLRATMTNDIRRIAQELNVKLESSAVEALNTQTDIMRTARDECLDPGDPDRRWEAGRLAVASAQDILSRTMPKPQPEQRVEHTHSHVHASVPEGFLNAVKSLDTNGHTASPIIDVTEPASASELLSDTPTSGFEETDLVDEPRSIQELVDRSPE